MFYLTFIDMVHIQKSKQEPAILTEFKAQENEDWKPSFGKLSDNIVDNQYYRTDFVAFLKKEQGNLCCYCTDNFDNLLSDGAKHSESVIRYEILIEHFLPQSRYKQFELDYQNLFAWCKICKTDSKNTHKEIHCGDAKDKYLIPNYLLDPWCEKYFKYNKEGEILPNSPYITDTKECEEKLSKLTNEQALAYHSIQILNLNADTLKTRRKKFFMEYSTELAKKSKEVVSEELERYKNNQKLNLRFKGLALFLINRRLQKFS
jgi:uncharacterized protein (TIGR02646 family)